MALGMELAINNAEETAVNVPFNSTGLQTAGRLFFLSCRGATSSRAGSFAFMALRVLTLPGLSLHLALDWRAIKVFSSGGQL